MKPNTRVTLEVPSGLDGTEFVRLVTETVAQHPSVATAVVFRRGKPILLELANLDIAYPHLDERNTA